MTTTSNVLSNVSSFNCYYTNAQSLLKKLPELNKIILENDIKLAGITETWASSDMRDSEFHIEGFNMYRADRSSSKRGGGVLMYIHESLVSVPYAQLDSNGFEDSVWALINAGSDNRILVGNIYRSPNSSEENNSKLLELLALAKQQAKITHLLVMGDFNMPEIDYNDYSVAGSDFSFPMRFFDLSQDLFLIQHVFEATRFRGDQTPSKLDYVFTNEENLIENLKYIAPLGLSDHIGLLWKFTCSVSTVHRQEVVKRAYWKGDYSSMAEILSSIDWEKEFEGADVEACWNSFKDKIRDAVDKFIPISQPRKNYHF